MQKVPFHGRILIIGCGGVAQCTLPLLLRHLEMPPSQITVIDMIDCREVLTWALADGVNFVQEKITPEEYREQLARYVGSGDMIIDLAWNIDCVEMLDWCHQHEVLYVNTSVELWDPYTGADQQPAIERTLYTRYMSIRKLMERWGDKNGPTAVLEHGANPGLVSHFTKIALVDITNKLLKEKPDDARVPALQQALASEAFNELARLLGVRVIHISERDTQVTDCPRAHDEFLNTWSVEGFFEEGVAPAEMGWGTHEQQLPPDACEHDNGPCNQICMDRFGMNTFVRSCVPSGDIVGMVIRHGEAFSISEALTVVDESGKAVYRPTVHYAYSPCDEALASLDSLRNRDYQLHQSWRIMSDDITSGFDELGVLLMGHDFKSWWTGTILDIEETRELVPGQNATTLQVAASVLSASLWMIRNPRRGVLLPDQLPHREIMQVARPYLGKVVSLPIDWVPSDPSEDGERSELSVSDPELWQFQRFLLPADADTPQRPAGENYNPLGLSEDDPVGGGKRFVPAN